MNGKLHGVWGLWRFLVNLFEKRRASLPQAICLFCFDSFVVKLDNGSLQSHVCTHCMRELRKTHMQNSVSVFQEEPRRLRVL